jgi:predicted amidohydrolase
MGKNTPGKIRVAAVQLNVGQPLDDILADVKAFLFAAKKAKVDIVCFPECSFDSGNVNNSKALSEVKRYCKELSQWCIIGCNLGFRGKTYNSALLLDSKGRVAGTQRKVHLCDPPNVRPGKRFEVFKTPWCKIGISICWDSAFPRTVEEMARKGAKVVFCPLMWYYERWFQKKDIREAERAILRSLIHARAYENLVGMVFANVYDSKDKRMVAYSAIAETRWVLGELVGKEGMLVADIDLRRIERMRKFYLRDYNKKIC